MKYRCLWSSASEHYCTHQEGEGREGEKEEMEEKEEEKEEEERGKGG